MASPHPVETMDCVDAGGPHTQQQIARPPPPGGFPVPPNPHPASSHQIYMPPPPPPAATVENPVCQLSSYEIDRKIGRGQFSVVYKARYKMNNQIVALKKVQVHHVHECELDSQPEQIWF